MLLRKIHNRQKKQQQHYQRTVASAADGDHFIVARLNSREKCVLFFFLTVTQPQRFKWPNKPFLMNFHLNTFKENKVLIQVILSGNNISLLFTCFIERSLDRFT